MDAFAARPEKPSPSHVAGKGAGQGAAFYNPFARSQAPAGADAPVQSEAPGDRSSDDKISRDGASGAGGRKLANGAALRLISSKRLAPSKAASGQVEEEGRLVRVGGGATMWVGSTSVDAAASDADAPKGDAPTSFDAAAVAADDYYGQGAPRTYSKLDAKSDVKSGGDGEPPPPKRGAARRADAGDLHGKKPDNARGFDQDDLTGLMIAIGMLFLLGWMWLQGRGGQTDEEAAVSPQMAANEPEAPAPLPDPFGPGPVDLRPDSPMPDPLPPEPLQTEPVQQAEAETAPTLVAPAVAAPTTVATAPPTQSASAVSAALPSASVLNAYFCTQSSALTPAARMRLEADLGGWKARVGEGEVVVTGFADTRGTTAFNAQLGELRADFVADLLRAQGFVVTEAVGVGELDSIEDERNCPHQRRVDIALKGATLSSPSRACQPPAEVAPLACG